MILVNTTFSVDNTIVDDFRQFIIDEYIPSAIKMCHAYAPLLTALRQGQGPDDPSSSTLALQMRLPRQKDEQVFASEFYQALFGKMALRWGKKVLYFSSVLDVLTDFNDGTSR